MARGRLNRERDVVVPEICLLEISIMALRGRIKVSIETSLFLEEALEWDGVQLGPVTVQVATTAARLLSAYSLDAMDALIAATAITRNVPLVTRDERLRNIPALRTVW